MYDTEAREARRFELLRYRASNFEDTIPRGERLRLVTEYYRGSDPAEVGEPLRRARACVHFMRHHELRLFPGDRLAGMPQRYVLCHQGLNQLDMDWAMGVDYPERNGGNFPARDKVPQELEPDLQYWQDRGPPGSRPPVTEETRRAQQRGVISASGQISGHQVPGFRKVLRLGLRGIIEEACGQLDGASQGERLWLEAVIESCQGVIEWANRCADLAQRMAGDHAEWRDDFLAMAERCRRVPADPPEDFHDAVQALWFIHRATEMEQGDSTVANSLGRIDQYLWPLYQRDLAQGRITALQAQSLLAELYLKLVRVYADQHILVGGVDAHGADATNELSYLILEVARHERRLVALGARVHANTEPRFWRECAELSKLNLGFSLFGDETTIPALVAHGFPIEQAREYAVVGCVEHVVPEVQAPRTVGHMLNMPKCLELALNQGRCRLSGEQLGPESAPPTEMGDFEDLWAAYAAQVAHFTGVACELTNLGTARQAQALQLPLLSATFEDPIAARCDLTAGGARYNHVGVQFVGLATTADSLAAIKTLVYDERALEMAALLEALARDFEGAEQVRQMLLHRAPKWGNNEPRADQMAARLVELHCAELAKHRTHFEDRFLPLMLGSTTASVRGLGRVTATTPDGRHARESFVTGFFPQHGRDVRGPSASVQSVAAAPQEKMAGGLSYILELHPTAFSGPEGTEKLAALLRSYFDLGGMNLAVNVLGPEVLREAQRDPEQHRSLSVRLFGYSEYFVNLDVDMQEFIIERTAAASGE